ncbi:serine hydrolase [Streptomyces sp. XM4193]|uniref:D-alanyl-D-alanine carboxypeptidase family protein n=1 Tax=Streptomyces sp. XM4193 TaxID=2929782 RepID=UPI001FF9A6BD|nr:serine hydrolase [Streptomyces sp. XM4193]MCK1797465.1 serine hydrolase [Streptomyces sp. XM4193]
MRLLGTGSRRVGAVALTAGSVVASGALPAYAQGPAQAQEATPLRANGLERAAQQSGPSGVTASGAFLLDGTANRALWGKGAGAKREMASTTKIMTAVVVVTTKGVDLGRRITIRKEHRDYVAKWGASTADLRTGDKLTARQLLYGLMLPSGCDAAYALADTFGKGSSRGARTKSFIAQMNRKATELGMRDTKFDSFDGISKSGNNYSTPQDLAKLTRYALGSKNLRKVTGATRTSQKATNGRTYTWYNTNQLLGAYDGVVGVKTGTGSKAGPCLVFAATRGQRTVVGVVLNGKDRYRDATRMLDWAFKQKTASPLELRLLPRGVQRD